MGQAWVSSFSLIFFRIRCEILARKVHYIKNVVFELRKVTHCCVGGPRFHSDNVLVATSRRSFLFFSKSPMSFRRLMICSVYLCLDYQVIHYQNIFRESPSTAEKRASLQSDKDWISERVKIEYLWVLTDIFSYTDLVNKKIFTLNYKSGILFFFVIFWTSGMRLSFIPTNMAHQITHVIYIWWMLGIQFTYKWGYESHFTFVLMLSVSSFPI